MIASNRPVNGQEQTAIESNDALFSNIPFTSKQQKVLDRTRWRVIALSCSIALAFWPIWQWYVQRLFDKSDEPLGLIPLSTFVVLSILNRTNTEDSRIENRLPILIGVGLAIYSVARGSISLMLLAIIALGTIGLAMELCKRRRLRAGDWLLLFLSLPLVASLNFYLGYPLRALVAQGAASILILFGTPVRLEGTMLAKGGAMIQVDPPCSGIKMLFLSLYIVAVISCYLRLNFAKTLKLVATAVLAAISANIVRVVSIFYLETTSHSSTDSIMPFLHEASGLLVFGTLAVFLCAGVFITLKKEKEQIEPKGGNSLSCKATDSNGKQKPSPPLTNRMLLALAALSLLAAAGPFMDSGSNSNEPTKGFSGSQPNWPTQLVADNLKPIPATRESEAYFRDFPGKGQAFTDGKRAVFMRLVDRPTRKLHAASDCYKAMGYEVEWIPSVQEKNLKWSRFIAKGRNHVLTVSEHIMDEHGNQWTDPSAWYWATLTGETKGPWWTITISSRHN